MCEYLHRGKSPKYSEVRKYPVFAQKCNQPTHITLEKVKFADPETIDRYGDECYLKDYDIVVNSTGTGTLGRVGLFRKTILGEWSCIVPDSHVTTIRCAHGINAVYTYGFLSSPAGQALIFSKQTGSTNQKELPALEVSRFCIPIPPLAEQQRIVAALDDLLARVDTIERQQAELANLLAKTRSKVLDLAIRGKLVPQDPADEPASVLLERIHAEKLQMVADGKLKKKDVAGDSVIYRGDDNSYYEKVGNGEPVCVDDELPFALPDGWCWCRLGTLCEYLHCGKSPKYSNVRKYPVLIIAGRLPRRSTLSCHTVPRRAASC